MMNSELGQMLKPCRIHQILSIQHWVSNPFWGSGIQKRIHKQMGRCTCRPAIHHCFPGPRASFGLTSREFNFPTAPRLFILEWFTSDERNQRFVCDAVVPRHHSHHDKMLRFAHLSTSHGTQNSGWIGGMVFRDSPKTGDISHSKVLTPIPNMCPKMYAGFPSKRLVST